MNILLTAAIAAALLLPDMNNPLLTESSAPFGAPEFDKIQSAHYLPAFEEAIAQAKKEVDAIVANPDEPTFENTIEALEFSGEALERISGIFYNIMEADTNDELEAIAEKVSPMMTDFSLYVNLNEKLFEKVKSVYDKRESLGLATDQQRLLKKTYEGFVRGGANLSDEAKKTYGEYSNQLSLLQLKYGKNALAATNAYQMLLTKKDDLAGLPDFVIEQGAAAAAEKGLNGWLFDLTAPSYGPFLKYSSRRDLREKLYRAYNTRAVGGEFDNTGIIRDIAGLRIKTANLLGYKTYAEYAIENKMAKDPKTVNNFIQQLLKPSLPAARKEVAAIEKFAKANGFEGSKLQPWDFSYWSEKFKAANYSIKDEELKPYFQLDKCIDAVFDLANRLYGLNFTELSDVPVYHKDVKVYDVTDESGRHLALFYADFFPRESKRGGAWMTEFRGQSIRDGVERRPFISIVTNFTKPTASAPSLITHDELTTFLHEFGHALHGIMAEGRYGSLTGTSVARDFVELPSQIMENWAFEPEYLRTFAKHYQTGEVIPDELIEKVVAAKNYNAAYYQVRQLQFCLLDMAWHDISKLPAEDAVALEAKIFGKTKTLPIVKGCAMSTEFNHIFPGGYTAGYYSYKWAEVLEADAFSLFQEKGIFNREVSGSFRKNILEKGSSDDEAVLYRNFRGHDPQPEALLKKLGITK